MNAGAAEATSAERPRRPRSSAAAMVLAVLAVAFTLWAAQDLILPVLLAMFLALVGNPIIRMLQRIHLPRFVGALLVLGLGIVFGMLGIMNMAHGEFVMLGAYSAVTVQQAGLPLPLAMPVAVVVCAVVGLLAERLLIRPLRDRPFDTLLATWGLSLIMQQVFRSIFGAREVSAVLPAWLMGSVQPMSGVDIPINGLLVMGLCTGLTSVIFFGLFRSRWGVRVRATTQNRVMSRATGIDTARVDRLSFALGCGLAGIAGAAFTTIGSTGPTTISTMFSGV